MYSTRSIEQSQRTCNIFRIKVDDSIICGFYYITFIEYMLYGKTLLAYTNLFPSNNYKK